MCGEIINMTYEFEYLMHLLFCGSRGVKAKEPIKNIDWDKMYSMSISHAITPIIAYAMKISNNICPEPYKSHFINNLRNSAINLTIRKSQMINVLNKLDNNGIKVAVLKGFAVGEYYALPESRTFGDVDIFVSEKEEKLACDILKSENFIVKPRLKNGYHLSCEHELIGHVELHIALYSYDDKKIKFKDINQKDIIQESFIKQETLEGTFIRLGKLIILSFYHYI